MSTFVSIDTSTIFLSKPMSFYFNIFITMCGFISFCIWLGLNTNYVISDKLFNPDVVITAR
jgi:hypothetical protein